MLEIILASQNLDKLAEMQDLLRDLQIKFIPQTEFNVPEVQETGTTFVENAIIKARHVAKHTGLPALADDSGLAVTALDWAPGVYSSRYAGENASDADRIQKVLKELDAVGAEDRSACFHSVVVLIGNENDPAPLICHGVWEGEVAREPRGDKGFGYDPIFYLSTRGCTVAELDPKEKNTLSHRGQALQQLVAILNEASLN